MEKCFSAILRLCSFSFCIWFYVFAPGSHCFAIDILNRSAICTVHFRSIWTAPLRFSTCRSWAGSKVTAAKRDPTNSNLKKKNQSSTFPTGFSFFHMNHWKWIYDNICLCGILMFKFNILYFNIGFQRKPEKHPYYIWEKWS